MWPEVASTMGKSCSPCRRTSQVRLGRAVDAAHNAGPRGRGPGTDQAAAALQVFGERGFHGATMQDVVRSERPVRRRDLHLLQGQGRPVPGDLRPRVRARPWRAGGQTGPRRVARGAPGDRRRVLLRQHRGERGRPRQCRLPRPGMGPGGGRTGGSRDAPPPPRTARDGRHVSPRGGDRARRAAALDRRRARSLAGTRHCSTGCSSRAPSRAARSVVRMPSETQSRSCGCSSRPAPSPSVRRSLPSRLVRTSVLGPPGPSREPGSAA